MPLAFDAASGPPPAPTERELAKELAFSCPDQLSVEREMMTNGTLPLTVTTALAWTVKDFATIRFTVLPSSCVTDSMGLVKQSWSGPLAVVAMLQPADTFSSTAEDEYWLNTARLMLEG